MRCCLDLTSYSFKQIAFPIRMLAAPLFFVTGSGNEESCKPTNERPKSDLNRSVNYLKRGQLHSREGI